MKNRKTKREIEKISKEIWKQGKKCMERKEINMKARRKNRTKKEIEKQGEIQETERETGK